MANVLNQPVKEQVETARDRLDFIEKNVAEMRERVIGIAMKLGVAESDPPGASCPRGDGIVPRVNYLAGDIHDIVRHLARIDEYL